MKFDNTCSQCGGDGEQLGTLGDLKWYRCQQCGLEFSFKQRPGPGIVCSTRNATPDAGWTMSNAYFRGNFPGGPK